MSKNQTVWGDEKACLIETRKQREELGRVLETDPHHRDMDVSDREWDVEELTTNLEKGTF